MSGTAVLVGAAALLMVGCSNDTNTKPTAESTVVEQTSDASSTVPTGDTAGGDGVEFRDPEGRFTVTFPAEPTLDTQSVPLPTGDSVDFTMYIYDTASSALAASCTDYSDSVDPGDFMDLDNARAGALANMGATLESSTDIEQQGRSGIDFVGKASGATLRARVFEDGFVLCQVLAIRAGGTIDSDVEFLDSFRFLEPAA